VQKQNAPWQADSRSEASASYTRLRRCPITFVALFTPPRKYAATFPDPRDSIAHCHHQLKEICHGS
jgi:hypothetical protein